jgi:BirA family biotin operon repressor/biotin-[acetyl-CoA-carboxylase] ligase
METTVFTIEKFDIKLDTNWIGRNFLFVEELDSTNSFLLDKKNEITIDGTVLFAEKQNKGRGRFDRQWYSTKGQNLTFSVLLTKTATFGKSINLLNLGSSVVVAHTIENLFQLKTELKWPNDVLINGKKISGILLESVSSGNKLTKLVVGIGLNVNQTIFQGQYNIQPTSLKHEYGQFIEREKLLAELLNNFEDMLYKLKSDPDSILKEWRKSCKLIGERISVVQLEETKHGVFEDIDEEGYLLLKSKNGIEKISFGDVSVY